MPFKLGIILGSTRPHSNTQGVSRYILNLLSTHPDLTIEIIHLSTSPGHPLPFDLGDTVPQAHPPSSLPDAYADPMIRQWSSTVMGWDGVMIVTPQYNWGYPAILKNAFDHLYHEWSGKPVGIVTLGGHGGGKCLDGLKVVLGGGLKMDIIEGNVQVMIPRDLIVGEGRIRGDEGWLEDYREGLEGLIHELVDARRKLAGV
ncbi:hypothetical protein I302_108482 [Kwoniella bestiolae CBS 10118]|uniref:NADPH-dependent FMN reductase-like domain-containing protein n=1 Tax=Kwoniella bestiolae CBS 10118 TaxID=1296100 RepID=A0A1B9FVM8_9TREE|nr:hypothetical protein I302_07142 [Kwoniella bestiolae CBS 10118]OCF22801.1 hypothetical protein I302_07142 [Kwoniella bestiolae CBS 10118]